MLVIQHGKSRTFNQRDVLLPQGPRYRADKEIRQGWTFKTVLKVAGSSQKVRPGWHDEGQRKVPRWGCKGQFGVHQGQPDQGGQELRKEQ